MMKSDRFRNAAKLVLGIGLIVCALACAVYGALMIPVIKGVPFQWEYLALIGFVAVLVLLVSLILFGIAKSEEEHELPEAEEDEERLARASVEVTFSVPSKPSKKLTNAQKAVVASVDCTGDTKPALSLKKLSLPCDKEMLKKIGMIAVPTVAVGLVVWSVSANIKQAKRAKRRRQFYRWLG